MATMDEYIDQLLAEIPDKNSALRHVVQNILDEPFPDFVKGRLLKPLQPGNYRPFPAPHKKKAAKRKIILEEFDHYLIRRRFEQFRTTSNRLWRCLKKSRNTKSSSTERHG